MLYEYSYGLMELIIRFCFIITIWSIKDIIFLQTKVRSCIGKHNQGKVHESLPRIDFVESDKNSQKYKKSFLSRTLLVKRLVFRHKTW